MLKQCLFNLLVLAIIFGFFTGCDVGDEEARYRTYAFVQDDKELGVVMASREGIFLAPELKGTPCVGECIDAFFKVDYNNQENGEYVTASDIQYTIIREDPYIYRSGTQLSSTYNQSMSGMTLYSHLNYEGKILLQTTQTGGQFNYRLTCNTDSADLATRKYYMYLQAARESAASTSTKQTTESVAFDLNDFITRHGKDTIVHDALGNAHKIRVADFYLRYQSSVKNDSIPVFKAYPVSTNTVRVARSYKSTEQTNNNQ